MSEVVFENNDLQVLREDERQWIVWKAGSHPAVREAIAADLQQGLAAMQQIIDAPPVSFSNLAQAQAAVRDIQTAVTAEARQLRRLTRLALNILDGTE